MNTVWTSIKLGGYKNPEEYLSALERSGRRVNEWAHCILMQVNCSQSETEINLYRLTVEELGFTGSAKYSNICARAQSLGLGLCPAEVGPALGLVCDQPKESTILIAMHGIYGRGESLDIFDVCRDRGEKWLNSRSALPDSVWNAKHMFVFTR